MSKQSILGRPAVIAATAILAFFTVGCSGQGSDIASLTGNDDSAGPVATSDEGDDGALASRQAQAAKDMVACLEQEGIESTTEPWKVVGYEEEFRMIMPQPKSDSYAYWIPPLFGESSGDLLHMEVDETKPLLIDGGEDLTSVLEACMASSGYSLPTPKFDSADEEIAKQQMAEVSNQWAACARENGIPGAVDANVTVDNWESQPGVVVPAHTDLQTFKTVVNECPPLNPDRDLSADNATDGGASQVFDPSIRFEPESDPNAEQLRDVLDTRIFELNEAASRGN